MRPSRSVVVSFTPMPGMREAIDAVLAGLGTVTYLHELQTERSAALAQADALLVWGVGSELRLGELQDLSSVRLIQTVSAGVENLPFDLIPPNVAIAANGGGWAEPMAEHVLALVLALAKRLPQNHALMARGIFDQRTPNLDLKGSMVAILGYGGIGRATAVRLRALGARIHAVTRTGGSADGADRTSALSELDDVLREADVIVLCLPLTSATRGLIGQRELALIKQSAILINVARAQIVVEDALYERLRDMPTFSAGLDVWWDERRVGRFQTRLPFLELPNVIASPHISANTESSVVGAARNAAENVARLLRGEPVLHVVDRSEYLFG